MTEQQQLSGRDLDRAIAKALGIAVVDSPELEWDDYQRDWVSLYYVGDDGLPREVPWYSADANAQYTICAERGWTLIVDPTGAQVIVPDIDESRESHYADLREDSNEPWQASAARALLLALGAHP